MKSMLTGRMGMMKRSTLFLVFIVCIAIMIPVTASAAYYNTYTTVATLNNANDSYATQGFAVGSTYVYSVKVDSDNSKAVIYVRHHHELRQYESSKTKVCRNDIL